MIYVLFLKSNVIVGFMFLFRFYLIFLIWFILWNIIVFLRIVGIIRYFFNEDIDILVIMWRKCLVLLIIKEIEVKIVLS